MQKTLVDILSVLFLMNLKNTDFPGLYSEERIQLSQKLDQSLKKNGLANLLCEASFWMKC